MPPREITWRLRSCGDKLEVSKMRSARSRTLANPDRSSEIACSRPRVLIGWGLRATENRRSSISGEASTKISRRPLYFSLSSENAFGKSSIIPWVRTSRTTDQPIHGILGTRKKQRDQIQRNIVDAQIADIFEVAAQYRLSRSGETGDHERAIEVLFTHRRSPFPRPSG